MTTTVLLIIVGVVVAVVGAYVGYKKSAVIGADEAKVDAAVSAAKADVADVKAKL